MAAPPAPMLRSPAIDPRRPVGRRPVRSALLALTRLPDLGGTGSLVGFTLIATALAACGLVEAAALLP